MIEKVLERMLVFFFYIKPMTIILGLFKSFESDLREHEIQINQFLLVWIFFPIM